MNVLRWLTALAGAFIVAATMGSAVRTVVLPRALRAKIARAVFLGLRRIFRIRLGPHPDYEHSDRLMALYAPMGLLTLVLTWEVLLLVGFAGIFWALEAGSLGGALNISGSSLLTLGTAKATGWPATAISFVEAALGLLVLALLITFLPSLYSAFSRREVMVSLLEVRAGSPPSAEEMIARFNRIHGLDQLGQQWERWELWFAELEESHTSFSALVFFRSPRPQQSWIIAAGAVLDAASLRASTIDLPRDAQAELCIRAGYLALRRIAAFFRLPHDLNPRPDDPITVKKEEFDGLCDRLAVMGIPLKPDREQCWRDFAGWRVNYDKALVSLAGFLIAPYAPWSSDRLSQRPPDRGTLPRPRRRSNQLSD
jgi:hypothetical protein